jgi:hypothetical protein
VNPYPTTLQQYREARARCRGLFEQKAADYGLSWAVMRPPSLTDQLLIKARRIRTLEETQENRVGESIESEFVGILNYAFMALMLSEAAVRDEFADQEYRLPVSRVLTHYDRLADEVEQLFERKNHDYGEAWRQMRVSSYTDMILVRLQRIREIEDQGGKTRVSEGIESNLMDIANYALFALIRISEGTAS